MGILTIGETMPMAVYTFLDSSNFEGKVIHPFCTHEGSGLSGTESDIANEALRQPRLPKVLRLKAVWRMRRWIRLKDGCDRYEYDKGYVYKLMG